MGSTHSRSKRDPIVIERPSAAEALLRRAIEPDRLVSHGASDLWGMTNQVATLTPTSSVRDGPVRDRHGVRRAIVGTTELLGGQTPRQLARRRMKGYAKSYVLL